MQLICELGFVVVVSSLRTKKKTLVKKKKLITWLIAQLQLLLLSYNKFELTHGQKAAWFYPLNPNNCYSVPCAGDSHSPELHSRNWSSENFHVFEWL